MTKCEKTDHVPRLFTTTRGEKPTFLAPRMSLFAALARRVATQISTSTMSSWCTADDTSALSASGLAQSASKFPSSRVPSALLSGAPAFPRDDKRDLVRPRSASLRSTRPLSAAHAARASIVRASMRGFWASAPWISPENRRTRVLSGPNSRIRTQMTPKPVKLTRAASAPPRSRRPLQGRRSRAPRPVRHRR